MAPTAAPSRERKRSRGLRLWSLAQLLLIASISCLTLQRWLAGVVPADALAPVRNALVLTAHPDDEAMFFAPTILALQAAGVRVYGLCLSSGDADGLGELRARELVESYGALGIPAMHVSSLDDSSLKDGMDQRWPAPYISSLLERYVERLEVDLLVTFDEGGVSHHANHRACFEAAQVFATTRSDESALVQDAPRRRLRIWTLATSSPAVKFLGLPKAILAHAWASAGARLGANKHAVDILGRPSDYWTAVRAMRKHKTQLVWFRYLYVAFSAYMRANTLHELLI